MFEPVNLLYYGMFIIIINLGAAESSLYKKYPLISRLLQAIAGLCMALSVIQLKR